MEEFLPQSVELTKSGTWLPELDSKSYPDNDNHQVVDISIMRDEDLMHQAMREVTGWLRPAEV
ncbi:hypothetical protein [Noviherbaspirillum saxi]|uniref:Uncharacterized protein n=1 Tax=Noviherbaspirillum saxi TaxID=2320863 RepID=A0A3A3FG38_9BURK|nr:hypothetical protein [Noviherbaspirillum saxi]RJF92150.1 hypothetical protein D3871_26265 [Noviherbaspirillum saxi]